MELFNLANQLFVNSTIQHQFDTDVRLATEQVDREARQELLVRNRTSEFDMNESIDSGKSEEYLRVEREIALTRKEILLDHERFDKKYGIG